MASVLLICGTVMGVIFTALYLYQFVFVAVTLVSKPKNYVAKTNHRYAALSSARNEEKVIGKLVESLQAQNYPADLIDIYVIADNCTDATAQVARDAGAIVVERFDQVLKGKSYALDYLLKKIFADKGPDYYDGFFVFDSDGVLDKDFVKEMNAVFDNGFRVVTSYRNSKNFDSNWLSAATGIWFMREGRFLSEARADIGTSCMISGTGFLVSGEILSAQNGWVHHSMTEDIQFSTDCAINDEPIGYASKAILYDEQPIHFKDSWNQRLRWARGFYQVYGMYWKDLVKGMFRKQHCFACFDIFAFTTPVNLITSCYLVLIIIAAIVGVCSLGSNPEWARQLLGICGTSAVGCLGCLYCIMFLLVLITTVFEWDKIHASTGRKISNLFIFPLFIYTYIPIAVAGLGKVEWKPVAHVVARDAESVVSQS